MHDATTLREFDDGYWYAEEVGAFAVTLRILSAPKLRKDQLETAIKDLLFSEGTNVAAISGTPLQAIAVNERKRGPLRVKHARYVNFISEYMADNKGASHGEVVRAWHEVKAMDAPKTYAAYVRGRP